MHPVAGPFDVDDHRMMDHTIDHGGRHDRITQVFAHGCKVDIGGQDGGLLAVTALDDLKKERRIPARFLLQAVKPDFID
jgi:hypothetical protein